MTGAADAEQTKKCIAGAPGHSAGPLETEAGDLAALDQEVLEEVIAGAAAVGPVGDDGVLGGLEAARRAVAQVALALQQEQR